MQIDSDSTHDLRLKRLFVGFVVVACCAGFLAYRIATPSTALPVDRLQIASGRTDEQVCANCHEQGETFWETGHALTLSRIRGSDSVLQELTNVASIRQEGTTIVSDGERVQAVHCSDSANSAVELGWRFGSGSHAYTWVGTLTDSWGATDLLEFRWTRYSLSDGFGVTPGQPRQKTRTHFGGLGVLFDHPKARRCFGCHASHVPLDKGRIQEHAVEAGVTCQRCHGPAQRHVASEGDVVEFFPWKTASQMEAIHRCAECHRREEEQDPDDITTDNRDIVRFQPVGLVQSPCFQNSDMTCVTCHNPHLPLEAQDSLGDWQCLQCHQESTERHTGCRAGHVEECLRCHMPKVKMDDPLLFTDHWIRVRNDAGTER